MIRKNNKLLTAIFGLLLLIVTLSITILTILIISQYSGFSTFGTTTDTLTITYTCANQYLSNKHQKATNDRLRRNFVCTFMAGIAGLVTLGMFIDFVYGIRLVRREYSGIVEDDQGQNFKEFKKKFYFPTYIQKICLFLSLSLTCIFGTVPCLHHFQLLLQYNTKLCPFLIKHTLVAILTVLSGLMAISEVVSLGLLVRVTRRLWEGEDKIRLEFERQNRLIWLETQESLGGLEEKCKNDEKQEENEVINSKSEQMASKEQLSPSKLYKTANLNPNSLQPDLSQQFSLLDM